MEYLQVKHRVDLDEVRGDTLLFTDGLLDSFSMVDLILFIEESAGITVSPGEVTLENLDSIERIVRFVGERASASR